MTANTPQTWSSRSIFILAAIGAAVGLGNIWKFPYTAGTNGGSAFVLLYVVAIALVAIPIVIAELLIGRRGRKSPITDFRVLAHQSGRSGRWSLVGWLNVCAVFVILSFYSVIAGWALAYTPRIASGLFVGASVEQVGQEFRALLDSPFAMAAWHGLFLVMTAVIVSLGLREGIEKAVKVLMPALFLILLALMAYASVAGDFTAGARFLFTVDFTKIDANVILMAIGQAFFSVSVAMGLLITYGAYMQSSQSILLSAVAIAAADTVVALMAGLVIFPLVFANGLDPAEGPGLIFVTLPIAFGGMPAGVFFGTIFFVLLILAALTSSIAILEAVIAFGLEYLPARRSLLAMATAAAAWVLGLATIFSFNLWDDVHPLAAWPRFGASTLFDLIDFVASNVMLPVGGILISLFAGWMMRREDTLAEFEPGEEYGYRIWRFLIRYVAPCALAAVLIANLL